MTDNISINIPKDGSMPFVEGSLAAAASVETRTDDGGNLQVRLTVNPVGEDALHGGSLEAVFTLTKPEFVENSDKGSDEQATIGAEYARVMTQAAQAIVSEHLGEFFQEAARNAVTKTTDDKAEHIANMCMMIACLLIVQAGGDKAKAKVNADISTNPELMDLAVKAGMDPKMVGLVTDTVREAIDLADIGS